MGIRVHGQVVTAGRFALMLVLATVTGGCSCTSSSGDASGLSKAAIETREQQERADAKEVETARQKAAARRAAQTPRQPKPPAPSPSAMAQDSGGQPPAAPRPKTLARPDNVADWKPDDFATARREGDPRLVAAVTYLGEHFAGQQGAVELLARLIEPVAEAPAVTGKPQPAPAVNAKLIEAVIIALATNGTPLARQTTENLITRAPQTPE